MIISVQDIEALGIETNEAVCIANVIQTTLEKDWSLLFDFVLSGRVPSTKNWMDSLYNEADFTEIAIRAVSEIGGWIGEVDSILPAGKCKTAHTRYTMTPSGDVYDSVIAYDHESDEFIISDFAYLQERVDEYAVNMAWDDWLCEHVRGRLARRLENWLYDRTKFYEMGLRECICEPTELFQRSVVLPGDFDIEDFADDYTDEIPDEELEALVPREAIFIEPSGVSFEDEKMPDIFDAFLSDDRIKDIFKALIKEVSSTK